MQLGIIGLPSSGKTTLFKVLTGADRPAKEWSGAGRAQVQTAVADVPDPRLIALSEMQRPRKTTHARINFADVGGLRVDPGQHGLPGPFVNQLEHMNALILVLRAFDDPGVPHPSGKVDPLLDLKTMQAELLLHDMMAVERSLERLAEQRQKLGAKEREEIDRRIALFERLASTLSEEQALRTMDLNPAEMVLLAGYGLLTQKQLMVVFNMAEGGKMPDYAPLPGDVPAITLQCKLEMEIAQLPQDEAALFLDEYGIAESGRDRVIRESYALLNLISFFTVSDPEVRAWMLRRDGTALEAADTIHTDMARGFIRAEVIQWDRLVESGGLSKARSAGILRLEGKEYIVQDGDVIYIRFNV